jgi:hypothetical protein
MAIKLLPVAGNEISKWRFDADHLRQYEWGDCIEIENNLVLCSALLNHATFIHGDLHRGGDVKME